jgi:predicted metal-dependent enzyme (double-stranded beta helix superfamily)
MILLLATAAALAADLHVDITTDDWGGTIDAPSGEPFTNRVGSVTQGKTQIAYEVTWSPAPHTPMENGYPLEIRLCRVWAKGKKKETDCITDRVVAKPESEDRVVAEGEVKMSAKWTYKMSAYATGDIPSTEMPMGTREYAEEKVPVGDVSTP